MHAFKAAARGGIAVLLLLLLAGCQSSTLSPTAIRSPTMEVKQPAASLTAGQATPRSAGQVLVVFDDDGSPDGTTALFYLLAHPAAQVRSISISYGEAHPAVYIQHIGRKLDDLGIQGIPLGAGQDAPLAGHNAFPEWLRQAADGYWGLPIPNRDKTYPVQDAAQLIVSTVKDAPEPVVVFVSGPSTNLAQALRLDPTISANIRAVYMMGGAIRAHGNIQDFYPDDDNKNAEWNIYSDPQAASEVFQSGLDLYLVPLDATNQVSLTKADTRQWRAGGKVANAAADMYDMLLSNSASTGAWDLMTAAIMLRPELCAFYPGRLDVVTAEGPHQGQTLSLTAGGPNEHACMRPDSDAIRKTLAEIFSKSK